MSVSGGIKWSSAPDIPITSRAAINVPMASICLLGPSATATVASSEPFKLGMGGNAYHDPAWRPGCNMYVHFVRAVYLAESLNLDIVTFLLISPQRYGRFVWYNDLEYCPIKKVVFIEKGSFNLLKNAFQNGCNGF